MGADERHAAACAHRVSTRSAFSRESDGSRWAARTVLAWRALRAGLPVPSGVALLARWAFLAVLSGRPILAGLSSRPVLARCTGSSWCSVGSRHPVLAVSAGGAGVAAVASVANVTGSARVAWLTRLAVAARAAKRLRSHRVGVARANVECDL